jgi:hypothetical protein
MTSDAVDVARAPRWGKAITILIIGCFVVQLAAILLRTGPVAFPFINYPMYANPHYLGERILASYTIHAVLEDGSEWTVTRQNLPASRQFQRVWAQYMVGLPSDTYKLGKPPADFRLKPTSGVRAWLKSFFSRHTSASAYVESFTREIEAKSGKRVVQYRIEDFPAILTAHGYEKAERVQVLKTLNIVRD